MDATSAAASDAPPRSDPEQPVPTTPVPMSQPGELTATEAEILEFERQWWRLPGAKEQAIRDRFGLSSTRYHQQLNALLDSPAALRADPMLVKRLQRLRSARNSDRAARRFDREA